MYLCCPLTLIPRFTALGLGVAVPFPSVRSAQPLPFELCSLFVTLDSLVFHFGSFPIICLTPTMCDLSSDVEKCESPLRQVDSSITLTNSSFPTPQSSRDSSIERQKETRPRMRMRMGHTETPSIWLRTQRYLYHDLDVSYSKLVSHTLKPILHLVVVADQPY